MKFHIKWNTEIGTINTVTGNRMTSHGSEDCKILRCSTMWFGGQVSLYQCKMF